MERSTQKIKRREDELFRMCVEAIQRGDDARAKIYANECAEVKKGREKMLGGNHLVDTDAQAIFNAAKEIADEHEKARIRKALPTVPTS